MIRIPLLAGGKGARVIIVVYLSCCDDVCWTSGLSAFCLAVTLLIVGEIVVHCVGLVVVASGTLRGIGAGGSHLVWVCVVISFAIGVGGSLWLSRRCPK